MAQPVLLRGNVQSPHRLIVVKWDRRDTLRTILDSPERWPAGTAVMLDRRHGERRVRTQSTTIERRTRLRRAEPDSMWSTHGFIMVETPTLPQQAVLLPAPRSNAGPRGTDPTTKGGGTA